MQGAVKYATVIRIATNRHEEEMQAYLGSLHVDLSLSQVIAQAVCSMHPVTGHTSADSLCILETSVSATVVMLQEEMQLLGWGGDSVGTWQELHDAGHLFWEWDLEDTHVEMSS